jgi:phosphoenolpyruvate phosphomutase
MQIWAGVYDALGALHAEQLGYDGLWLSSLGLSVGRLGLPDADYLDPETVLAAIREISRVVNIALVVDIENGYGLPGAGLAEVASSFFAAGSHALCIEDTVGAKRNSLWHGFHRDLSDVDEMADRLTRLVG